MTNPTNWKAFLIGFGGSCLALSPLLLIVGLALPFGGGQ